MLRPSAAIPFDPESAVSESAKSEPPLWIVIPTHNRAKHLCEAIGGALAQNPDAVIVVDDGSTDKTQELLRDAGDSRVCCVRLTRSHGVNVARRTGTGVVPSDAVVVELDDHDLLATGAIKALREAFSDRAVSVVYADADFIGPGGQQLEGALKKQAYQPGLFRKVGCQALGVRAYRKAAYDACGGWRLDEWPAGDYGMFLRMERALGDAGFLHIPRILCHVRRGIVGSISVRHATAQALRAERMQIAALGEGLREQRTAPPPPRIAQDDDRILPRGKHCLIVVPFWGPSYGGGELTMLHFARRLLDAGIEVRVAAKMSRLNTARGWWDDVPCETGADSAVRIAEQRPRLVLFQDTPTEGEAAICKRLRIPYVIQFAFWRNLVPHESAADWDRINKGDLDSVVLDTRRAALWGASEVFANSAWMRERIEPLLLGRHVKVCRPPLAESAIVKGRRRHQCILLPQAQIPKGLDIFLRLAQDFPDERFVGLNLMGVLPVEVKRQLKELSNVDTRKWEDDIASLYARSKMVFIATKTAETFCRAAAEARVNGIPLLVSDAGNLPNICNSKRVGRVVSRKAGYSAWEKAFKEVLAMKGRAPKDAQYLDNAGTDRVITACRGLMVGKDIAVVYPEGAPGIRMVAEHLAVTAGTELFGSAELGKIRNEEWKLVILCGGFGPDYKAFVQGRRGASALLWGSSAAQMEWHPVEKKLWSDALQWVDAGDKRYIFTTGEALAADQRSARIRWLPCTFDLGGRAPLRYPDPVGRMPRDWHIPLLGPCEPRKRLGAIVNAAQKIGLGLRIAQRVMDDARGKALTKDVDFSTKYSTVHDLRTEADVINLFMQCDVAAFPSDAETFCYSAAEAMLAGLPTIVSQAIPIGQYRDEELRHRLVLSGDTDDALTDDLTKKLGHLRDFPNDAAELGRRCRDHAYTVIEGQNELAREILLNVMENL